MSLLTAVTTNAPSKPTVALSIATENNWLCQTFGLSSASTDDFYTVARSQHQAKRFHLAVKCLEIYIARVAGQQAQAGKQAQVVSAALRPNGKIVGSTFTSFSTPNSLAPNASTLGGLQHTSASNPSKSLPVAPVHLLGFCHYGAGDLSKARECFLACVRLGYEADWQMLVQIEHELSEALRVAAGREARAGKDAVATLRKHLAQNQRMREGRDIDDEGGDDTLSVPPEDEHANDDDGTTTGNQSEQESESPEEGNTNKDEETDPDQQSGTDDTPSDEAASSDESDGDHQQQEALNSIRGSLQQFEITSQPEQGEDKEGEDTPSPATS